MITPQQYNFIEENTEADNKTTLTGKSFLFDFEKGEFVIKDGKPVEVNGYEALKMWIKKTLYTTANKYTVYIKKDEYGVEDLKELVTSDLPFPFKKSEIERIVKETLLKNTAIKSVQNFKFERNKRLLNVSFNVITIYGTVESEVNI